jgi:hypothetical protein
MNFGVGRDRPIWRRHNAINESFPTKNIRAHFPEMAQSVDFSCHCDQRPVLDFGASARRNTAIAEKS